MFVSLVLDHGVYDVALKVATMPQQKTRPVKYRAG